MADQTIQDYQIQISADLKPLDKGLKAATTNFKQFFADVKKAARDQGSAVLAEQQKVVQAQVKSVDTLKKTNKAAATDRVNEEKKVSQEVIQASKNIGKANEAVQKRIIEQMGTTGKALRQATVKRSQAEIALAEATLEKKRVIFREELQLNKDSIEDQLRLREKASKDELAGLKQVSAAQTRLDRAMKDPEEFAGTNRGLIEMGENLTTISEGAQKGDIAGLAGMFGGLKAGVAGIAVDLLAQAGAKLFELGEAAHEVNQELEVFSNVVDIDINTAQFAILRDNLFAIQRPLELDRKGIVALAKEVSAFDSPDGIVDTTEAILNLQRLSGGKLGIDEIVGQVGALSTQMNVAGSVAADLMATLAGELRGKTVDPVGEIREINTILSQAMITMGGTAEGAKRAAQESATLFAAFAQSGNISDAGTKAEETFLKLNDAINDPAVLATITKKLPAGLSLTELGLEKGNVSAVKFLSKMQDMGEAGKDVANALGSTAGEGIAGMLQQMETAGVSIDDINTKFANTEGAAERAAAKLVSTGDRLKEIKAQRVDDLAQAFGQNLAPAVASANENTVDMIEGLSGQGLANGLASVEKYTAAIPLVGQLVQSLDSVRLMFVDAGIEAARSIKVLELLGGQAASFDLLAESINKIDLSGTEGQDSFITEVNASMEQLKAAAPEVAAEIQKISTSADAASPENIQRIKDLMQEISDVKSAEAMIAMQAAIGSFGDNLTQLEGDAASAMQSINQIVGDAIGSLARGLTAALTAGLSEYFDFGEDIADSISDSVQVADTLGERLAGAKQEVLNIAEARAEINAQLQAENLSESERNGLIAERQGLALASLEARKEAADLDATNERVQGEALNNALAILDANNEMQGAQANLNALGEEQQLVMDSVAQQFSTQPEIAEELNAKLTQRLVLGKEAFDIQEQLIAGEIDATGAVQEGNSAKEESFEISQALLEVDKKIGSELDSFVKTQNEIAGVQQFNTDLEIRALEAKRAKNSAVIAQLKAQIAAIQAANKATAAGVDAEVARAKAAKQVAVIQAEIQQIIAGEKKTSTTKVEKIQAGNLAAVEADIATQIKVLETANESISGDISDLRKGVKKTSKSGGSAKREVSQAKKAEDTAQKEKESEDKKRIAMLKKARKDEENARKKLAAMAKKARQEAEKRRKAREKAEAAMIKAITDSAKALSKSIIDNAKGTASDIQAGTDFFKTQAEKFAKKIVKRSEDRGEKVKASSESAVDLRKAATEQREFASAALKGNEEILENAIFSGTKAGLRSQHKLSLQQLRIIKDQLQVMKDRLSIAKASVSKKAAGTGNRLNVEQAFDELLSLKSQKFLKKEREKFLGQTGDFELDRTSAGKLRRNSKNQTQRGSDDPSDVGGQIEANILGNLAVSREQFLDEVLKRIEKLDTVEAAFLDLQAGKLRKAETLETQAKNTELSQETTEPLQDLGRLADLVLIAKELAPLMDEVNKSAQGITTATTEAGAGSAFGKFLTQTDSLEKTMGTIQASVVKVKGLEDVKLDKLPKAIDAAAKTARESLPKITAGIEKLKAQIAAAPKGQDVTAEKVLLKSFEVAEKAALESLENIDQIKDRFALKSVTFAKNTADSVKKPFDEMNKRVGVILEEKFPERFAGMLKGIGDEMSRADVFAGVLTQLKVQEDKVLAFINTMVAKGALLVEEGEEKKLAAKQKFLAERRKLNKKEADEDKAIAKAKKDKQITEFKELVGNIDAAVSMAEELETAIPDIADAFASGAGQDIGEGVSASGDMTRKIGEGLLNSGIPALQTAGAVLLGVGLVTQLVGKIISRIQKDEESSFDIATRQLAVQASITAAVEARAAATQQLVALGNAGLDTAKEMFIQTATEAALFRERVKREAERLGLGKNFLQQTEEQLVNQKKALDLAEAENQARLTKLENDSHISRKEKRWIEERKGLTADYEKQVGLINTELEFRVSLREKEIGLIDEQIGLEQLRQRLGQSELQTLIKTEELQRKKLFTELIGDKASREAKIFRKTIGAVLKDLGLATETPFTDMPDLLKLSRVELENLLRELDRRGELGGEMATLVQGWLDASDGVESYRDELIAAQEEQADLGKVTFDQQKSFLNNLKEIGEGTEFIGISQEDFAQKMETLLRKRLEELTKEGEELADNNATAKDLLENEIARQNIEKEILSLLAEQNEELDTGDLKLTEILRKRQALLRTIRDEASGRAISPEERNRLKQITEAALAQFLENNPDATQSQIDAFKESLPKFEQGSAEVAATGPAIIHKGEMILPANMAKDFRDFFSTPEARIVGQAGRDRDAANRTTVNNLAVTLNQNNDFTAGVQQAIGEVNFLGLQAVRAIEQAANEGLETGRIRPGVRE